VNTVYQKSVNTVYANRKDRRDATHARILDEANALVVEEGLEALSMRALAARVGLTAGALYRYFPSQDALVAALTARAIADLAAGAQASGPPLRRILALADAYRRASVEQPHRFGLIAVLLAAPRVVVTDPEAQRPVAEAMIGALTPLVAAFAEAEATGDLPAGDPSDRAVIVFGALQGLLTLRKQARFAPERLDPDRLVGDAVRTLLVGWGAAPSSLE
jgi:AcrR family transcriptional regulator